MLSFKRLELYEIEKIRPFLEKRNSKLSDFTVGGIFMWRDYLKLEYCINGETLFLRAVYPNEEPSFCLPFGGDEDEGLAIIFDYCKTNSLKPYFFAVSADELEVLREKYAVLNTVSERDSFDYLYNAEDMLTFAGKKFNGQRNHINKFKRLYPDYVFEDISGENIAEVLDFCRSYANNNTKYTDIAREDNVKVREVLEYYSDYGFFGGLVRVGGEIIAVSVGERVNDTLFIHIEKADIRFPGAYQMIVNEFAKRYATDGVLFINREDDVGDEGLRTSKLSYHPIAILEKNTVLLGGKDEK